MTYTFSPTRLAETAKTIKARQDAAVEDALWCFAHNEHPIQVAKRAGLGPKRLAFLLAERGHHSEASKLRGIR